MTYHRQRFSQHFLNSTKFAERIIAHARISGEIVIEIGPGKGALTRVLAGRTKRVFAIELDPHMVEILRAQELPHVDVLHGDFLEHDITQYGDVVVVGNVPYAISTAIVEKLIDARSCVKRAVLTVQREFAQRLVAQAGTKAYGFLSVVTGFFFTVRKLFAIPPRFFTPTPQVGSTAIYLQRCDAPLSGQDQEQLLRFIKHVFGYPRKSLKNSIKEATGIALPYDLDDRLHRRPGSLTRREMLEIYRIFTAYLR